jgi:hypothetical protein
VAAHWIEIAEALRAAVATQLSVTVERRYTAYFDKEDVKDGKYLVVGNAVELVGKRGIDLNEITIDLGLPTRFAGSHRVATGSI